MTGRRKRPPADPAMAEWLATQDQRAGVVEAVRIAAQPVDPDPLRPIPYPVDPDPLRR